MRDILGGFAIPLRRQEMLLPELCQLKVCLSAGELLLEPLMLEPDRIIRTPRYDIRVRIPNICLALSGPSLGLLFGHNGILMCLRVSLESFYDSASSLAFNQVE